MSTAERTRLGGLAIALLAGDEPSPRAARLGRLAAGQPRPAITLAALAAAPEWLGWPADRRRELGYRAALATIGPQLAASVDGRWLGGLARTAGDKVLDWAMRAKLPEMTLPRFEADDLDGVANGLLRAAVAPALRDYAAPPLPAIAARPALAEAAVAHAAAA